MQIVIELDKDITESLNDGVGLTDCQYKSLVDAITNGTPLPKDQSCEDAVSRDYLMNNFRICEGIKCCDCSFFKI